VQGRPIQNPTLGGAAPQQGYSGGGQSQHTIAPAQPNEGQPQFSLEGYCPVTLVHNRVWTPGDKRWGAVHEGRTYLFAGPEQQQQFLASPHIYAPLMEGYDPVRFAETGQLVPGRREFGLYIDDPGPIALFADEAALERFHANSNYYFDVIRQAKMQQAGRTSR
jgi:protein disulfide-isomerase